MLGAKYKKISCCLLLAFIPYVSASEAGNDALELSGFATLGTVYSDSDHHGYRKNINSDTAVYAGDIDFKQHTLLGLQENWSISSNFDFVYQGVLRDLPKPSFDRYTTLAFLRYEVNANWSVRVGRTAPDLFLLTEYRDVDFSYIWATAPNEVYGMMPYRSLDGVDVTYSQRAFGGVFKTKLFTGSSESEISGINFIEDTAIEDVIGLSLSFDHFNWIVNLKHSQITAANESINNAFLAKTISQVPDFLWPNSQDFAQSILIYGEKVSYTSVSGQYRWGDWLATTEFSQINSKSNAVQKTSSGYAALSYQLNAHQFYTIYALANSDNYVFDEPGVNEVVLEDLIHGTMQALNFFSANQKTLSLGWRWDITNDVASSLQWNYTQIEDAGSVLWLNKSDHNEAENVNTVLLTLSMVF